MAVYLYDEALTAKIKNWISSANIQVFSPNDTKRLFEVIADTTEDKPLELPLISLSRHGGYNIENTNHKPLTYDGFTLEANTDKSLQLNAIPISIQYQLDIYTRYLKQADELMRNIIFNIINYPLISVQIPYQGQNIIHDSSIRLASQEVQDNSDIPERLIVGQFTRLSALITIDDAYLWDVRLRDNYSIDVNVEMV